MIDICLYVCCVWCMLCEINYPSGCLSGRIFLWLCSCFTDRKVRKGFVWQVKACPVTVAHYISSVNWHSLAMWYPHSNHSMSLQADVQHIQNVLVLQLLPCFSLLQLVGGQLRCRGWLYTIGILGLLPYTYFFLNPHACNNPQRLAHVEPVRKGLSNQDGVLSVLSSTDLPAPMGTR